MSRRSFLASGALAAGALVSPAFLREAFSVPARAGESPYGPLGLPNGNGLMLPPGFSSREVARGLAPVSGSPYAWPIFSDGQATFGTADGGWILVTNSESVAAAGAGSSAIRFDQGGRITDAYRILAGTDLNCGGGPTPWGTWLSCEEYDGGLVWECDPAGVLEAVARPALGVFKHEAAAVEPVGRHIYLTEDQADGGLYRFTPVEYPDLSEGLLEVAVVVHGRVGWRELPDPAAVLSPTRQQVPEMTRFHRGEGIWHDRGVLYFTTTAPDNKLWAYDARAGTIEIVYDRAAAPDASLEGLDNVVVSASGEIFVCEDEGNMEIGLVTPAREVSPFLRFAGDAHSVSEVCGVVFNPSGTRMYCTSQGAFPPPDVPGVSRPRGPGAVYEISGPFRQPPGGSGSAANAFGPPAGERSGRGPLGRAPSTELLVHAPRRVARRSLMRRGLRMRVRAPAGSRVSVVLSTADLARQPGRGATTSRPETVALSRARFRGLERTRKPRLRLGPKARRRLGRRRRTMTARVLVTARLLDGRRVTAVRTVRVLP